jgi:hypothetical protein
MLEGGSISQHCSCPICPASAACTADMARYQWEPTIRGPSALILVCGAANRVRDPSTPVSSPLWECQGSATRGFRWAVHGNTRAITSRAAAAGAPDDLIASSQVRSLGNMQRLWHVAPRGAIELTMNPRGVGLAVPITRHCAESLFACVGNGCSGLLEVRPETVVGNGAVLVSRPKRNTLYSQKDDHARLTAKVFSIQKGIYRYARCSLAVLDRG